ncbi:MAG: glycosyltransferase family 39 protein [Bryobacteraceae bacterium]
MKRHTLVVSLGAVVCIAAHFLYFAGAGLAVDFTHDDLLNLFRAWYEPLSTHLLDILLFFRHSDDYRPMGVLFYRLLFDSFGFEPAPFRLAFYTLLAIDLVLAYAVVRRLANSRLAGVIAALLLSYNRGFWSMYTNTGFIFDVLCFAFYCGALLYYLRAREERGFLRWRQVAIWSGIYVLCLNSKEMSVTLPVMIAVYEVLHGRPWTWRACRVPLAGSALAAAFIFGRVLTRTGLASMEAFHPVLRLDVYLSHGRHFLSEALYQPAWLTPIGATALMVVLAAAAIRFRRRSSLPFLFVWMLVTILPVAFIQQRSLDAVFIPALGLAAYVAICVVEGSKRIAPNLNPSIVFLIVLVPLVCFESNQGKLDFHSITEENRHIRKVYRRLQCLDGSIRPGSRILFLADPFPALDWNSTLITHLSLRERNLHIRRVNWMLKELNPSDPADFDVVLSWEDDRIRRCDATRFHNVPVKELDQPCRRICTQCPEVDGP